MAARLLRLAMESLSSRSISSLKFAPNRPWLNSAMIESRGGTRRKRSKRTNDPWHSVAWGLAVIAFVALVGGVAWFAFSRIFAPRPVEYVQNPEVPVVFALENLVEGAY